MARLPGDHSNSDETRGAPERTIPKMLFDLADIHRNPLQLKTACSHKSVGYSHNNNVYISIIVAVVVSTSFVRSSHRLSQPVGERLNTPPDKRRPKPQSSSLIY